MAQGYRVLGESRFHVGRYDEAVDALSQAIEQDPSQRRVLLPLLAESQLNAIAPLTEQALQTIEAYLRDPALMPRQRWAGELIHLRVMIALGMWEQVKATVRRELQGERRLDFDQQDEETAYRHNLLLLESVADVTRAMRRHGRYAKQDRMDGQQGDPTNGELIDALAQMNKLQREASSNLAAQARLWLARAHLIQGKTEDALGQLTAVRRQRPFRRGGDCWRIGRDRAAGTSRTRC